MKRALLVFVALWPAVTLVLQSGFHVDPWKLMSFGMYSVPPRREATLGALDGPAEWRELDPKTARVRVMRVQ
ncbi:MAG: hypothetical protein ACO1OB_18830 [Archangium sp.]